MGGGPLSEDPLQAAARELKEETGLQAEDWQELIRLHTSNSVTDELGIAYIARGLTQGETDFDEMEDLELRRIPLEEAVNMALEGEITDSLSVAALMKAKIVLGL